MHIAGLNFPFFSTQPSGITHIKYPCIYRQVLIDAVGTLYIRQDGKC
jgi:hypothetical protein